ncbi:unnamed protein product [Microthlaspi erraticum]|uniref:Uncharacterized protein n=1 Tax=Microthlaspi erraticum TaxID=1685480 RepID=A0A6D2J5X2_9BRAS|nr:unnamed protein product [Microthlaspi erraticum]
MLKLKHKHALDAFMGSYDRFTLLHRQTIQLRKDMVKAENELAKDEQDSLDCGAASHEADREMAECVERLKETSAKMGEKWEVQIVDTTGKLRLTGLQKCTAAIHILTYGNTADAVDGYLQLGASIALTCTNLSMQSSLFTRRMIYL